MTLRKKLEDNPCSLTHDELSALKNNHRLNIELEGSQNDVSVKNVFTKIRG